MKKFSVFNLKLINIQHLTQSKNFLIIFFLLTLISSYKFINSTIPIYLVCFFVILINFNKIKLSKKNIVGYLFFIIFLGIFLLYSDNLVNSLRLLRYYFGFLIFYLLFNLINIKGINFKYIIIFLICWVIIESFLINTLIHPSLIIPDFRNTKFLGFYYRPWSFNANPTATSGILILIYYFVENSLKINLGIKNLFLLSISIILLFSTTGFVLMFFFLIFKFIIDDKNKIFNIAIIILFLIILIKISTFYPANYYSSVTKTYYNFEKISPAYLFLVFDYKLSQFIDFLIKFKTASLSNLILGYSNFDIITSCNNNFITSQDVCFSLNYSGIGGDFGFIDIFNQIGFLGAATFILLFVFLKNNNLKLFKLYFLIFVSFFHYPIVFMPLGQLFLGYILSNNFNYEKKL